MLPDSPHNSQQGKNRSFHSQHLRKLSALLCCRLNSGKLHYEEYPAAGPFCLSLLSKHRQRPDRQTDVCLGEGALTSFSALFTWRALSLFSQKSLSQTIVFLFIISLVTSGAAASRIAHLTAASKDISPKPQYYASRRRHRKLGDWQVPQSLA